MKKVIFGEYDIGVEVTEFKEETVYFVDPWEKTVSKMKVEAANADYYIMEKEDIGETDMFIFDYSDISYLIEEEGYTFNDLTVKEEKEIKNETNEIQSKKPRA